MMIWKTDRHRKLWWTAAYGSTFTSPLRFSLAPDETLFAKCDLVGNPSDDALSPAQHTPLALANLAGDVRHSTHGALQVQSMVGDPAFLAVQYPPPASDLTAGEWNRAASANNRVEIRVR